MNIFARFSTIIACLLLSIAATANAQVSIGIADIHELCRTQCWTDEVAFMVPDGPDGIRAQEDPENPYKIILYTHLEGNGVWACTLPLLEGGKQSHEDKPGKRENPDGTLTELGLSVQLMAVDASKLRVTTKRRPDGKYQYAVSPDWEKHTTLVTFTPEPTPVQLFEDPPLPPPFGPDTEAIPDRKCNCEEWVKEVPPHGGDINRLKEFVMRRVSMEDAPPDVGVQE